MSITLSGLIFLPDQILFFMLLPECSICRMISGELDSFTVYDDDQLFAFLHIDAINEGHTLLVAKEHPGVLTSLPKDLQAHMIHIAAELGKQLQKVTDSDGYNIHYASGDCAGQGLQHAHLHIIPRRNDDGFSWNWRGIEYSGEEKHEICTTLKKRMNRNE